MQNMVETAQHVVATARISAGPVSWAGGKRRAEPYRQGLLVLALVVSDLLLALLAYAVAAGLYSVWRDGAVVVPHEVALLAPSVTVWVGLRALLGLYPGYGLDQVEELRRQTYATLATLAIIAVFASVSGAGGLLLIVTSLLQLLLLTPAMRYLVKWIMLKAGLWGKPVLVLGSREAGVNLLKVLRKEWQMGLRPVVVFDEDPASAEEKIEGICHGGTLDDSIDLARDGGVDTVIFAMPHAQREDLAKLVNLASTCFRYAIIMPDLGGITNSAVVARDFAGNFGVEIKHNLLDPWVRRTKRVLDLVATVIGGALIFPLILLLALMVHLESRGGLVFYRDRRMGRDGELFSCIKFRTMVPEAEDLLWRMLEEDAGLMEEYSKYHKLKDDPRVTRVGHFLRKTSLDELPQLWNVLRGEMSLVGPRPYLHRESKKVGVAQSDILRVPPGITGSWQVAGRNNASFEERIQMDAYYVRDWSVWLDIVLLARTAKCVILGRGAY